MVIGVGFNARTNMKQMVKPFQLFKLLERLKQTDL